jgi:hypothetical protein
VSRREAICGRGGITASPTRKGNMKQRIKQNISTKGDFICRCGKAKDSLDLLRKHQEFLCAITMRRTLNELHKSITKMNAENLAQHEKDLREWEKEKACDVSKMSKSNW